MPEMLNFLDASDLEREKREKIDPSKMCRFGIAPLDDAFVGILPNDLVAIGADSGMGKSQLALDMAVFNALNNKIVALYFIEGGALEATARIKWKLMSDLYFRNYKGFRMEMNYRKWRMNISDDKQFLQKLEKEAVEECALKLARNLNIYHFEKDFTVDNLLYSLGYFAPKISKLINPDQPNLDLDIIIIDHLQYFTLYNPKDELKEMTDILKQVKKINTPPKVDARKIKKGYRILIKVWETDAEIGSAAGVTQQAASRWKYNGIPRKRRQALVDASNGKIKSIEELRR